MSDEVNRMMTVQELHATVLQNLTQAKVTMKKLMAISDDWTTKAMLESDFDSLEQSVRDFGRFQLGIRRTRR